MNRLFKNSLSCIGLLILSSQALAAQKLALIIGNSKYQTVQDSLKNPVNDAKAIQKQLKELGFDTRLLSNANLDSMLESINSIAQDIEKDGTILFYYAGHGMQLDGKNYLIPVDARMANRDRVAREAVLVKEVLDKLNESPAAARIVIIDACRNDPFPKTYRSGTRGLTREPLPVSKGLMIMYAASEGEVADDGTGENGTFTAALLNSLSQANLKLPELMDDVATQVQKKTQNKQNPYSEGRGLSKLVLNTQRFAEPTIPTIASEQPQSIELAYWESIKNSTNASDYAAYLADYPRGRFASLAKSRQKQYEVKPIEPSPKIDTELSYWESIKNSTNASDYAAYLADYPRGRFASLAKSRQKQYEVKPIEPSPKVDTELSYWESIKNSTNASDYAAYLADYPRGRFASLAKNRQKQYQAKPSTEPVQLAQIQTREQPRTGYGVGQSFKDCADCPEMVVVPSGSFKMGSNDYSDEKPVHQVTINYSFAVGKYEVTFAEWDACVADGGCGGYRPDDNGWGRGTRPVMRVSWQDAQRYVNWLSEKTGQKYRLLSESEWEYVARAGSSTKYSWGNDIGNNKANCDGCGSQWDNKQTAPVGSFAPNAFGLYDVHGNVWEWVEDCWHTNYEYAPDDGSAWSHVCDGYNKVLRGGSWNNIPLSTRSAYRNGNSPADRSFSDGFRVSRSL